MIAIVHAFNEYMAEEYCTVDPDRLIAMAVLPNIGVEEDIREMENCEAARFQGRLALHVPKRQRVSPCPKTIASGRQLWIWTCRSLCARRFPRMSVPGKRRCSNTA